MPNFGLTQKHWRSLTIQVICMHNSTCEFLVQSDDSQHRRELAWEYSILKDALESLKDDHFPRVSSTFADDTRITQAYCRHNCTALIQQCVEDGEYKYAIELYQAMLDTNEPINRTTYQSLVKACARFKDPIKGQELHVAVIKDEHERNSFVGGALVDMYGKCSLLAEAQDTFDELAERDVVVWTTLIAGYAEHGDTEGALECFYQMQADGFEPNDVTFACILKACNSGVDIEFCHRIHCDIIKEGFECNHVISSSLISLYSKHGYLNEARDVFDEMSIQNVATWTALITQYGELGHGEEAFNCFKQMKLQGVFPNAVTYTCILKAIGNLGTDRLQALHEEIVIEGYESDSWVCCILLDLYTKFKCFVDARHVLDEMQEKNVISWTALMAGYVEHGHNEETLVCFEDMKKECVLPNEVTYTCILKAISNLGNLCKGQEIHAEIIEEGYEDDTYVGNSLLCMYGKCGTVAEAQEVFDELQVLDVSSWNSLITGYIEQGFYEEALICLEQMQAQGMSMDIITFVCSLKACGSLGILSKVQYLHSKLILEAYENFDPVGNTLIGVYAKYGLLEEAQHVFRNLPKKDTVSFTSLIDGYACQGEMDAVSSLFERMRSEDVPPDRVTFLSILTVCSHVGFVELVGKYFLIFTEECGVSPTHQHHNCILDAFGRAGRLSEIITILEAMPFEPNHVMWITILGACWKLGDRDFGRYAFECASNLDEALSSPFVLMGNIYVDSYERISDGVNMENNDEISIQFTSGHEMGQKTCLLAARVG